MSPRGFLLSTVFCGGLLFVYAFLCQTSHSPSLAPFAAVISSPQTNLTFAARPAAFGPILTTPTPSHDSDDDQSHDGDSLEDPATPPAAISGPLYLVRTHACSPVLDADADADEPFVPDLKGAIALVLRGECSFYTKVLNLQSWGASAVIVGDIDGVHGLLTMSAKGDTSEVQIPSFFVSHQSYLELALLDSVSIIAASPQSPVLDTLLFLLVSPLLSLSFIYAMLMFHRRLKRMRDRAPKAFVDSLPVRVWGQEDAEEVESAAAAAAADIAAARAAHSASTSSAVPIDTTISPAPASTTAMSSASTSTAVSPPRREKLWGSSAECVICLEDYIPSVSRVMRLPCRHEFHANCITPWLTLRKRTCPICKRDVTTTDLDESSIQLEASEDLEAQPASGSSDGLSMPSAQANFAQTPLIDLSDDSDVLEHANSSVPLVNLPQSSQSDSTAMTAST
ncbi:uncharacterized protein V1516DRAFT_667477 [Lipomyces oligophaga]|uniref:uncharacterized protein n=1 Tax=Lipomyces oligophaga TaxID=45792 RepID=UPI0034CEC461